MRIAWRVLLTVMIAGAAACTQESSDSGGRTTPPAITLEDTIRFDAVDGAVEYRIQVWDGLRLLFEETREAPALAVTPSMRRSLRGASHPELRVWGIGADGRTVGEVLVRPLGQA